MNPIRSKRLSVIGVSVMITVVAVALILFALRENIQLYLTPAQLLEQKYDATRFIRLGGLVAKQSLHEEHSRVVLFKVTDLKRTVPVEFKGILPALFKEGRGVIVGGHFLHGHFIATEVLAKHDENYHPPNMKSAGTQTVHDGNDHPHNIKGERRETL